MEIAHHYLRGGVSDFFVLKGVLESASKRPMVTKYPICAPEPEGCPKQATERTRRRAGSSV